MNTSVSLWPQIPQRAKLGFFYICGIILGPLYKSCCNPSYTIQGALSGAGWRMIHGSCLLCSRSLLLHRERALWSAGFGVEGFCFPLVWKWQICSVKCLWQQKLCKRCILFLEGEISFEMLLLPVEAHRKVDFLVAVSLSDRSCNFGGIIRASVPIVKKCPFVSIVFHLGN